MQLLKSTLLGALLLLSMSSCDKNEDHNANVEATGVIQKQGITTYQYGTHVITGYALRSSSINLDDYIGQNVTVVGPLIEGYPVDGGPEYIEVEEIK